MRIIKYRADAEIRDALARNPFYADIILTCILSSGNIGMVVQAWAMAQNLVMDTVESFDGITLYNVGRVSTLEVFAIVQHCKQFLEEDTVPSAVSGGDHPVAFEAAAPKANKEG